MSFLSRKEFKPWSIKIFLIRGSLKNGVIIGLDCNFLSFFLICGKEFMNELLYIWGHPWRSDSDACKLMGREVIRSIGMLGLGKHDTWIALFIFVLTIVIRLASESACVFPTWGTCLISNISKADIFLLLPSISIFFPP